MDELTQMHCVRVSGDTPPLTEEEIQRWNARLPGWKTYAKDGEPRLEKSFRFPDFRAAMAFTAAIAQAADAEDHHPALLTEWGWVTVTWWTHRIQGLHRNDFIMAAKTEALYAGMAPAPTP
jgi:4a-hydroxytetrahydrobiopterin dehydratase